ncbi:MAG: hypothetical protein V2B18_10700, partial [Pseudomonadota bacterium]
PAMIGLTRKRFPGVNLVEGDIMNENLGIEPHDYVVASGIFAFCLYGRMEFMKAMVSRMFSLCTRGCAFNSLSTVSPGRQEGIFYVDPVKALAMSLEVTRKVVLFHNYSDSDFTVFLYRENQQQA